MNQELEFNATGLPGHVNPDEEADRSPINFVQLALDNKWVLLGGLLVGALLGHLAYLKAGPEFEASSQILVWRKYTPPMRETERMLHDTGKPSEHVPIIMSPEIAERAVKIGNLKELPTFSAEPDLVDAVLDGLKVKRVSGQDRSYYNVLDIRYPSRDANDARKVVQSVIAGYEEYLTEQSSEYSTKVMQLAKKSTADLEEKIHEKEAEHQKFMETVPEEFRSALGPKQQATQPSNVAPQDVVHTLGDERNKNKIEIAELKSRQKNIETALATGLPHAEIEAEAKRYLNATEGRAGGEQAGRSTEITVYQSQLLPLILREQELSRTFGKDHPELVSVRQSMQKVIQVFRSLGVQLPDGVNGARAEDKSTERLDYVAIYLASVRHQLAELQLKDLELENLMKEEGLRSAEFETYRNRDEELRGKLSALKELWAKRLDHEGEVGIEKDTNGYSMKILTPVKEGLVVKRMMKFYTAGSMAGVILVAAVCLLRELRDSSLKTVRDVRMTLRQPVLGSVVAFELPTEDDHSLSSNVHPGLRYLVAPHSIEAENYRTIRTAITVSAEQHSARVILISSPEPGDGKTTLVCNLAIALAQSGKRVLLIDGDLRRPNVHSLFRIPSDVGLIDVLRGEIQVLNAIVHTEIEGLSLLPAGQVPQNPSEILSSPRLPQMLRDVRDEYDFVFVDAPPLLAVSDPCILARHTDCLLIVSRINKNTRGSAVRVREVIETQGIRVLGAIANGVVLGKDRGYSSYGDYVTGEAPKGPTPVVERLRKLVDV